MEGRENGVVKRSGCPPGLAANLMAAWGVPSGKIFQNGEKATVCTESYNLCNQNAEKIFKESPERSEEGGVGWEALGMHHRPFVCQRCSRTAPGVVGG